MQQFSISVEDHHLELIDADRQEKRQSRAEWFRDLLTKHFEGGVDHDLVDSLTEDNRRLHEDNRRMVQQICDFDDKTSLLVARVAELRDENSWLRGEVSKRGDDLIELNQKVILCLPAPKKSLGERVRSFFGADH